MRFSVSSSLLVVFVSSFFSTLYVAPSQIISTYCIDFFISRYPASANFTSLRLLFSFGAIMTQNRVSNEITNGGRGGGAIPRACLLGFLFCTNAFCCVSLSTFGARTDCKYRRSHQNIVVVGGKCFCDSSCTRQKQQHGRDNAKTAAATTDETFVVSCSERRRRGKNDGSCVTGNRWKNYYGYGSCDISSGSGCWIVGSVHNDDDSNDCR